MWCGGSSGKVKDGNADGDDAGSCAVQVDAGQRPVNLTSLTCPAGAAGAMTSVINNIPEVNVDLLGMQSHTIVVRRGPTGFGFTVFGSSPVQICRVDPGSPAAHASLQTEDYIARINGQNVSRSTAESVARIVRESDRQIVLEIQRPPLEVATDDGEDELQCIVPPPPSSRLHQFFEDFPTRCISQPPRSAVWVDGNSQQQHRAFVHCGVTRAVGAKSSGRQPFASIGNLKRRPDHQQLQQQQQQQQQCESNSCSGIGVQATVSETDVATHCRSTVSAGGVLSRTESLALRKVEGRLGRSEVKTSTPMLGTSVCAVRASQLTGVDRQTQLTDSGRQTGSDETSSVSSTRCRSYSDAESEREDRDAAIRQVALRKLASCEREFSAQMSAGVEYYISALREQQLTSHTEHAALFLNLETICSLAEGHADRWRECNASSSLSQIYASTIESLCEAYEAYCGGVRNCIRLLVELKRSPDFAQFLKAVEPKAQLTLSAFLKKPVEHIKDLVLGLQKVISYTPTEHNDHENLRRIVQAVRSCCNRINSNNMYASSMSLASTSRDTLIASSSWSSSTSSLASSCATTPASVSVTAAGNCSVGGASSTCSVVSSIDSELLEIQSRLVFPRHIPMFHLATASHHLIYSGSLTLVDSRSGDRTHTPAYAVLMSDLLLLTRPDPDTGSLTVLYEPIALQDIVGSNFQLTAHPCEFLLSIETRVTSLQETWQPYAFTLRAPSVELKCTWKNILEQRVLTCKAQRKQLAVNRSMENIV